MIHQNVLQQALDNTDFRRVIVTNEFSQVVIMSLLPGEEIGAETHKLDQVLYFVAGSGLAKFNGESIPFNAGDIANVPAGTTHNFINTSSEAVKLITVYSPPEHPDGTVHKTKAEADASEHHH